MIPFFAFAAFHHPACTIDINFVQALDFSGKSSFLDCWKVDYSSLLYTCVQMLVHLGLVKEELPRLYTICQ